MHLNFSIFYCVLCNILIIIFLCYLHNQVIEKYEKNQGYQGSVHWYSTIIHSDSIRHAFYANLLNTLSLLVKCWWLNSHWIIYWIIMMRWLDHLSWLFSSHLYSTNNLKMTNILHLKMAHTRSEKWISRSPSN